MLGTVQVVGLARDARGKVDHQGAACLALLGHRFHGVGQGFKAAGLYAILQFEAKQFGGACDDRGVVGVGAQPFDRVKHQHEFVTQRSQCAPQAAQQRRQRAVLRAGQGCQKAVADIARQYEL